MARTLGIDPILIRVAFVVLTIFGGSGIVLYLVGWLLIPESGQDRSRGERFLRDHNTLVVVAIVVLAILVLGPIVAWRIWDGGFGFGGLVLLLLAGAAVIALSRRASDEKAPPRPVSAVAAEAAPPQSVKGSDMETTLIADPSTPTDHPTAVLPGMPPPPPPGAAVGPVEPPPPPAPPKEKSVLGRLTVGIALLVSGALIALDVADVISVSAVVVISSALAVVALGLLVGAFVGRSRGLIALGICLVLVVIPLSAVPDGIRWNTGEGVGDRIYHVKTIDDLESEYALGAGSLTLDLRALTPKEAVAVDVSVGVGELIVMLPPDVPTHVESDVGAGVIDMPLQQERDGVDLEHSWTRPVDEKSAVTGSFDLTLSTGIGSVTVIEERQNTR